MGSASWMSVYCGPRDTLQPTPGSGSFAARQVPALALLEATGLWAFEEKHDGCWADARVEQGMLSALTSRVGLPLTCDLVGQTIAGLEGFTGRLVGELVADVVEGQEFLARLVHAQTREQGKADECDQRQAGEHGEVLAHGA